MQSVMNGMTEVRAAVPDENQQRMRLSLVEGQDFVDFER